MKTVDKKILPAYYEAVASDRKLFELREDEDYEVGDIIILNEWNGKGYTGRTCTKVITYILRNCEEYGLQEGYCILGLSKNG